MDLRQPHTWQKPVLKLELEPGQPADQANAIQGQPLAFIVTDKRHTHEEPLRHKDWAPHEWIKLPF